MNESLKKIECVFLIKHFRELEELRARVKATETTGMTIGEAERAKLLAATGAASLAELIETAAVVKCIEREALIQVHNLLYFCNQYGFMRCTLPAGPDQDIFRVGTGPGIALAGGPRILERLGARTDGGQGYDRLYNYSACVEKPVRWLA